NAASPAFIELMRFEANRAWQYYEEGTPLLNLVSHDSQAARWTLMRIYSGIRDYRLYRKRGSCCARARDFGNRNHASATRSCDWWRPGGTGRVGCACRS